MSPSNGRVPDEFSLAAPCVQDIGYRYLLNLWISGLRRILVQGADCSQCDLMRPFGQEDGVTRVNEILQAAGKNPIEVICCQDMAAAWRVIPAEKDSVMQQACSRRDVFKGLALKTLDAISMLPPSDEDFDKRYISLTKFLDVLRYLDRKGQYGDEASFAAYQLHLSSEACYGCMACARLCPTRAMVCDDEVRDTRYQECIRIDPSLCHGCGICRDVCDVSAIEITFNPGVQNRIVVPFWQQKCSICRRTFLSPSMQKMFCPGCRMRAREMCQDI